MILTDSHCHIDFEHFTNDLEPLLRQCYQLGIHRLIIPAIAPNNWDKILTLSGIASSLNTSNLHTKLFACLGIHPWFMNTLEANVLDDLSQMVHKHAQSIVAIGETGIDKPIADSHNNLTQQVSFFEHHLNLSAQYDLPVVIHHRRSHDVIIPLLKKYKLNKAGVIHAFSGSYQQAKSYVDLGFKIGVGGTITYKRAQKTINAIKKLPLDSLLLETDAPSMPLQGFQGEDNSPLQLVEVLQCLKSIREESTEEITRIIENNVEQLFFNR